METPVDIRYAGVVVARATEVRPGPDGVGWFLAVPEPLPVGTMVALGPDAETVRVEQVIESADAGVAGMLVRPANGAEALPPPPAPRPVPRPEPVVEVRAPEPAPPAPEPAAAARAPRAPEPEPEPPSVPSAAFADPQATVAPAEEAAPTAAVEHEASVAAEAPAAADGSDALAESVGDLPPARPVAAGNRRGSRRRRK